MDNKKATIKVFGRVQGVFFRHNTKIKAERLGLTGLVSNEIDGSVKIIVEGDKEEIRELVNWAKIGPPSAQVIDIKVKWSNYQGEFSYFRIE